MLISFGLSASAQTGTSPRKKLLSAKQHIVNGTTSEAFDLLSDLWQESIPNYIRGEALYLSATLAEYAIGRSCNQPNAYRSYESAAELGNEKAKNALKRIDKYGFAEPTENNRKVVIKELNTDIKRDDFQKEFKKAGRSLQRNHKLSLTHTLFIGSNALYLKYKISPMSPYMSGLKKNEESAAALLKKIPVETLLMRWNINELFESLDLKGILIDVEVPNYMPSKTPGRSITTKIERTFLRKNKGTESPAKVTSHETIPKAESIPIPVLDFEDFILPY